MLMSQKRRKVLPVAASAIISSMKKPLPQKKQTKGSVALRKKRWVILASLIAILVLVCIAWAIVAKVQNDRAIQKEKQQFSQVEKDLTQVPSNITSKIGLPDGSSMRRGCSYAHREFTKGPLACAVDTTLVYGVSDESGAINVMNRIQTYLKSDALFQYRNSASVSPGTTLPLTIGGGDYIDTSSLLHCASSFIYYRNDSFPAGYPSLSLQGSSLGLLFNLSCGGSAKQAIYPVLQ
jgi:hypothetical protein